MQLSYLQTYTKGLVKVDDVLVAVHQIIKTEPIAFFKIFRGVLPVIQFFFCHFKQSPSRKFLCVLYLISSFSSIKIKFY